MEPKWDPFAELNLCRMNCVMIEVYRFDKIRYFLLSTEAYEVECGNCPLEQILGAYADG